MVWEEGKRGERSGKDLAGPKTLTARLGGTVSIHLWKVCYCGMLYFLKECEKPFLLSTKAAVAGPAADRATCRQD